MAPALAVAAEDKLTLDQFVEVMREFCKTEDQTLWDQGDAILAQQLNDKEMAEVAKLLQRSIPTLRLREKVSREFPADERDHRVAWGVYRVLVRLPQGQRADVLGARTKWTIQEMTDEVSKIIGSKVVKDVAEEVKTSGGFLLGDFKVVGTKSEDGTITLTSPNQITAITSHDLGPAGLVIVITP